MENLKTIKKSFSMLSFILASVCLNAQAPTSGLVGHFSFDALSSGNVICDSGTASGNEGTLTGAALTSDSKSGANALEIDPSSGDSYVAFDASNTSDFCSQGRNNGVKYVDKFDDAIIKTICKGMCQESI